MAVASAVAVPSPPAETTRWASLAMARSGSRRSGKPTYASMMTWFGPAMCGCCGNATQPECTLNITGPGFSACSGEQAGHSSSLLKRVWAHAWWSGIGEMVMDGLRQIDSVAYIRFASVYKDFTDAKDFEEFAGTVKEVGRE